MASCVVLFLRRSIFVFYGCRSAASERSQKEQHPRLEQIHSLYADDFHVVHIPLLDSEVRGVPAIEQFSSKLVTLAPAPPAPPKAAAATQ